MYLLQAFGFFVVFLSFFIVQKVLYYCEKKNYCTKLKVRIM